MATNIQLLTQQAGVASATARALGHGLTASAVSHAISVSQQGQTSVANVSATSTSPPLAAAIANTYVARFIASQQARQRASVEQALNLVERQIAALSTQQLAGTNGQALIDRAESLRILAKLQDGGAQVVTPAKVPKAASSPKVTRNTVLGLVLGLLLGLTIAFLLERLDRRMKTVDDLEAAYRLPLLAAVPHNKSYAFSPQEGVSNHGENEVFRLLRAYLRYFNVDREVRSLLVASAAPGDGKTTVARNLAQAAQETGTKALLIEADMRRPCIAAHYGASEGPGLSELLIGGVQAQDAIRSIPIATRVNGRTSEVTLDMLVAGHAPPNPAELIESQAMAAVLAWATEHYELVVIDTPPLSVVSDAIPLLPKVDGVVIVSQIGKNTRDAAAFLRERLIGMNAPLLGVVANGV
jgi:receptor protein-tyrosine kinase